MLYSGASLGQVRREIKAPQRRFTRELSVVRLRRVADPIRQQWA